MPEAMQRQRTAASRPLRVITPEARGRWNHAYKLKIKGLTRETFQAMLAAQGYACAMCLEPFEEGQLFTAGQLSVQPVRGCPVRLFLVGDSPAAKELPWSIGDY